MLQSQCVSIVSDLCHAMIDVNGGVPLGPSG